MEIRGFQETSFLDWDGKVCSVVYTPGCNFRCPFCHNGGLVLEPQQFEVVSLEKIEKYLVKHKDFIDGICLTGGEPCLQEKNGLFEFLKKIKRLGFSIKLDTNGANSEVLQKLFMDKLVDYIAMDIKGPIDERYDRLSGIKTNIENIKESIKIIMESGLSYEFRTTVVPSLLSEKDIEDLAKYITGAKKFVLQQFVPKETLDPSLVNVKPYEKEQLDKMVEISKQYVPNTVLRGI